jgi:serine protease Do
MNKNIWALGPLAAVMCAVPTASAADKESADLKQETKRMRVLAAPESGAQWQMRAGTPVEKEAVTFLGVETAPASATLAAQLNLPKGAGLVVRSIIPESPAGQTLQVHDILLKFEDQLLVEQRQLSVLIRQKEAGDEVTLTIVRGGKQTTAKVKLGTHEVPKFGQFFTAPLEQGFAFSPDAFELAVPHPGDPTEPEDVDRVLSLMKRHPDEPFTIHIDRQFEPGIRAVRVHPENSNLVFSDDKGSLELTVKNGEKMLVAKDAKGSEQFSGAVTTPEQRKAMPAEIRARLEELEGMQDDTFKTDGEFRGAETKIVRPLGRGVALPLPPSRVAPGVRAPVL